MSDAARRPRKVRATAEALLVLCGTLGAVGVVYRSAVGQWERKLPMPPCAESMVMLAAPLLWLAGMRRSFASHGMSMANIKPQLQAVVTCAAPFGALGLLNVVHWGNAGGIAGLAACIVAPFMFGFLLTGEFPHTGAAATWFSIAMSLLILFSPQGTRNAAIGPIYLLLLLGPSEEVLFRGVIQSGLNHAFGRPFTFFGARWGWGAILAGLLFGLAHVYSPLFYQGQWHPNWPAGITPFFLGLSFAFLRERTDGIIAPAILHGLPQAVGMILRPWLAG